MRKRRRKREWIGNSHTHEYKNGKKQKYANSAIITKFKLK
jgi:hypothetical protein